MYIEFNVEHQTLERTDDNGVVEDSVRYLKAKFQFTEDWDGYTKTAFFGNLEHGVILDGEGICLVPWEMLRNPESITISVIGVKGNSTITTNGVKLKIRKAGFDGGIPDPSPSMYAQLLGRIEDCAEAASDAANDADEANLHAERAEQAAKKATDYESGVKEAAAAAKTDVESAGAAQEESIRKTGDGQVKAVTDKGQEVLNSIPPDYQTLTKAIGINLDHYRGDYDAGTTYNKDDLVFSGGATYWHKGSSPTKGVSTADTSVWMAVSTPSQLQEEVSRVAGEVETAKAGISQLSGEIAAYGLAVVDGALCVKFEEG